MSPTEHTIGFLRTLTYDGFLSSDEVWLLAKFLNEHEESRKAWPGTLLFPLLRVAFSDGELSESEMTVLASTLATVEQQWIAQKSAGVAAEKPEAQEELGALQRPLLPKVNLSVEIPSSSGNEIYEVNLIEHSCTCPDWMKRRAHPVGHLGRCCKHVAQALEHSGIEPEPWLQAVLADLLYRGKGTHPSDQWLQVEIPRRKPVVISGGSGAWFNVFASTTDGYERYGFNLPERRWSYGEAPRGARQIQIAIFENFSSF